jgi:glycopeptide antibiotics resistance protein
MKKLTILFAVFLLVIILLADAGSLGFLYFVYDFPYGDKAGHFILFGIFSFLLNLTFLRSRPISTLKRVAVTVTVTLALVIGLEEFSQGLFAHRTSDLLDLLSSYTGAMLGAWLAYRMKRP